MNVPLLIAETPNAGTLGHRFLISAEVPVGDSIVSDFVNKGRQDPQTIGANYIVVRRKVTQRSTGRPGADETLVLVGVDCVSLSAGCRAKLTAALTSLLPHIDETVREIDWDREKRLVVPHETLYGWISEDMRSLPRADISGGPRDLSEKLQWPPRERTVRRRWGRRVLALILLLAAAACVCWMGFFLYRPPGHGGGVGPPTSKGGPRPPTAPTARMAQRIEQLRQEIDHASKGIRRLESLKTRLNELEQENGLTKAERHRLDDLRSMIEKHLRAINDERAQNREDIDRFFSSIDKALRSPIDPQSLKSLVTRIDLVPHPECLTDDDRALQDGYRKRIFRESQWGKFRSQFQDLSTSGDWKRAAAHFRTWTDGKDAEIDDLRSSLKANVLKAAERLVNWEVSKARFSQARKALRDRYSSQDLAAVLGVDAFRSLQEIIDCAEDLFLYERVVEAKSVTGKQERASNYLESEVMRKRMQKEVQALQTYLETANDETLLTFSITGFRGEGANTIMLTVQFDGKPAKQVKRFVAKKGKDLDMASAPIEVQFRSRPNDWINVGIEVLPKKGEVLYGESVLELSRKAEKWQDLSSTSRGTSANQVLFRIGGLPEEPKLPKWRETADSPSAQ